MPGLGVVSRYADRAQARRPIDPWAGPFRSAPAGAFNRWVAYPMPQQTGRHHHLYNTRRWQRRAKLQITEFPLCAMCLARKIVTPATVADHVEPHRGDDVSFT